MGDNAVTFRLADLPGYAKVTLTFFLLMLGVGYLAAVSLIFLGSIGKGKPPTPLDIQDHYGGVPLAPGARPLSGLEAKFLPELKGADGKIVRKEGSMFEYLTRLDDEEKRKEDDPKRIEDRKRADGYVEILKAWVDIVADEAAGKRPKTEAPDVPEPATSPKKFVKDDSALKAVLADAKKLNAKQFYESYAAVILAKHCVRCHGGGNPNGPNPPVSLDSYETVGKFVNFAEPSAGMTPAKLALHIHIHAVTMGFMALSAAVLMFFTGYSAKVKMLVLPWTTIGGAADIAGMVFMKLFPAGPFAYLTMAGGGVFGLTLAVQILLIFFSMWFGRREAKS